MNCCNPTPSLLPAISLFPLGLRVSVCSYARDKSSTHSCHWHAINFGLKRLGAGHLLENLVGNGWAVARAQHEMSCMAWLMPGLYVGGQVTHKEVGHQEPQRAGHVTWVSLERDAPVLIISVIPLRYWAPKSLKGVKSVQCGIPSSNTMTPT